MYVAPCGNQSSSLAQACSRHEDLAVGVTLCSLLAEVERCVRSGHEPLDSPLAAAGECWTVASVLARTQSAARANRSRVLGSRGEELPTRESPHVMHAAAAAAQVAAKAAAAAQVQAKAKAAAAQVAPRPEKAIWLFVAERKRALGKEPCFQQGPALSAKGDLYFGLLHARCLAEWKEPPSAALAKRKEDLLAQQKAARKRWRGLHRPAAKRLEHVGTPAAAARSLSISASETGQASGRGVGDAQTFEAAVHASLAVGSCGRVALRLWACGASASRQRLPTGWREVGLDVPRPPNLSATQFGDDTGCSRDVAEMIWVECDACGKWREVQLGVLGSVELAGRWTCSGHADGRRRSACSVPEDPRAWEWEEEEEEEEAQPPCRPPPTPAERAQLVERLEEHMASHGLTQVQVAKALKVSSAGKLSMWLGRCREQTLGAATMVETDAQIAAYLDVVAPIPPVSTSSAATASAAAPRASSTEHEQLRQRLREHMAAHGKSQKQVASAAGLSCQSRLSVWLGHTAQNALSPAAAAEVSSLIAAYLDEAPAPPWAAARVGASSIRTEDRYVRRLASCGHLGKREAVCAARSGADNSPAPTMHQRLRSCSALEAATPCTRGCNPMCYDPLYTGGPQVVMKPGSRAGTVERSAGARGRVMLALQPNSGGGVAATLQVVALGGPVSCRFCGVVCRNPGGGTAGQNGSLLAVAQRWPPAYPPLGTRLPCRPGIGPRHVCACVRLRRHPGGGRLSRASPSMQPG